ncbi:hypothetical protein DFH09DRAFT_1098384 [Mycena vulgaris]|nr:hypothetical protein DFH09DRAFT_1098384 [Mycena vulgaris]
MALPPLPEPRLKPEDPASLDPYAEAAQAVEQAQRILEAARAVPITPMISVASAERQFAALRAEIAAHQEARKRDHGAQRDAQAKVSEIRAAHERERAELRAREKDLACEGEAKLVEMQTAHERERTELQARMDALRTSITTERTLLNARRSALVHSCVSLQKERAEFVAERDIAHKAINDERAAIVQNMHRMIRTLRGIPLPRAATPTTLIAVAPSTPHPGNLPHAPTPGSLRRPAESAPAIYVIDGGAEPDPRKRQRTDDVCSRLDRINILARQSPTPWGNVT